MITPRTLLLLLATTVALGVGLAVRSAGADPSTVLEATLVDIQREVVTRTYSSVDHGSSPSPKDDRTGTTKWRVVASTGNCCENYLTSTSGGRLFDFGGTYVHISDDLGLTWKQVRPLTPLNNGEGTIAVAPNGDIIGIGWDPYTGDHLQAFKYEAFSGKWWYNELPLHTPFYDREWVTVVPGPFSVDGRTVPYISFLKGGYPSKELWLWSSDGLNYYEASSKFVDATQNGVVGSWLTTKADATFDWIQPNSNTGLTPLGGGVALAAPDFPFGSLPPSAPSLLSTQNHPESATFSGAVPGPDGSCDVDKGPWVVATGESVDSITVAVVAELTANDSVVHLKHNGNTVLSQDTITSPEALNYNPPGDVPAGSYTVQVCDFANDVPWLDPKGYTGRISFNAEDPNPSPGAAWSLLDPATQTWTGYAFGDGSLPQGRFQVDSAGRIHNVIPKGTSFDYRISTTGGRTWSTVNVPLPNGMSIEHYDFRANKAAGVGAVVIRADKADAEEDQDLAYKLDIRKTTPALKRSYFVGLGDAGATAGVQSDVRMDFQTVTILPNGALAVSFLDDSTYALHFATGQRRSVPSPNIAIELSSSK
jgi:hypothetical protein